jgi:hypothetical protein
VHGHDHSNIISIPPLLSTEIRKNETENFSYKEKVTDIAKRGKS